MPIFEVELCGTNIREDYEDNATFIKEYVEVDDPFASAERVIKVAMERLSFEKCGIFWNPSLSRVINRVSIL